MFATLSYGSFAYANGGKGGGGGEGGNCTNGANGGTSSINVGHAGSPATFSCGAGSGGGGAGASGNGGLAGSVAATDSAPALVGGFGGNVGNLNGQNGHENINVNLSAGSGGGGGRSSYFGGAITNSNTLAGGNGGAGGNAFSTGDYGGGGGGGGEGAHGAVISGGSSSNSGTISGGAGGAGGAGSNGAIASGGGGSGGDGGNGVQFTASSTITNTGTITGGAGGAGGVAGTAGTPGTSGLNGRGGAGVVGSGITIINNSGGIISGGLSGDGSTRANAITFTGGSNILRFGGGTLIGNIGTAGSVNFNFLTDQSLSNTITGTGSIIASGTGTLTLSAANSYTGSTEIQNGVNVQAAMANVMAGSVGVTLDSGVVFDAHGHDQTLTDLAGSGSLWLASSANGATLTVNTVNGSSWSGIISDNNASNKGNLVVTNSGAGGTAWVLGAAQTYTGTTNITSGAAVTANVDNVIAGSNGVTIDGIFNGNNHNQLLNNLSGSGAIAMGSGNLALNIVGSSIFGGAISGSGNVTANGNNASAITILTGNNTYTGTTDVQSGVLEVDGSITSSVTVDAGATLKGSGTINGNVINNSLVAPGDSPGTLTVNGNYSGSGTLQEQFTGSNASPNFDKLVISGTASLSNQTLDYVPLAAAPAASYVRGTSYTILTSGGLGGTTFGNAANGSIITAANSADIAASPAPALAIRTTYTPDNVIATIMRAEYFGEVGATPNQQATGNALDPLQLTAVSGSDMDILLNALSSVPAAGQPIALDMLSGSINAELPASARDAQMRFDGMVGKRLGGDCNIMGAPAANGKEQKFGADSAAWACGYGNFGNTKPDVNQVGVQSTLTGFATGYEFKPSDLALIRVGVGYAGDTINQRALGDSATLNSYQIGAYGQYKIMGDLYVGSGLSGSYNTADTKREIVFGGLNQVAKGTPDGYNIAASAVVGYEAKVNYINIEPVAGLEYIYNHQNSFNETGAAGADLLVDGQSTGSLRSTIGAQLSTVAFDLGNGMSLTPEARAAFIYDSLTVTPTIDQSFAGGAAFTVKAANPGRAGVQGGAGLTLNVNNALAVFVDYNGTLRSYASDNSIMCGLKYSF